MADMGRAMTNDSDGVPGGARGGPRPDAGQRSKLERLGLALIAVVMAAIFGGLSLAAWIGNEVFLAAMAAAGALMTIWAAASNLRRG
jgi:hypothetical protein